MLISPAIDVHDEGQQLRLLRYLTSELSRALLPLKMKNLIVTDSVDRPKKG
jgi:hypothetical protein